MAKKRAGYMIDLLLALILCALYFVTSTADGYASVARMTSAAVYRGYASERASLQFAVSWNARNLEGILDVLRARGVRATFAVSGEWAQENPDVLLRIVSDGHEIATMGCDADFDGSALEVTGDVERSLDIIEGICCARPALYYSGLRAERPSTRAARLTGLLHVKCTMDALCARGEPEDIINRVSTGAIKGSIILLTPTANALEALDGVIDALLAKGLSPVTTGELITNDGNGTAG